MKIITTRKTYYKNTIIPVGTVLEVDFKEVPLWGKELKTTTKTNTKTKTDDVLFDELLTKAIENNIEVNLESTKDIKEKIAILQEALKGIK